VGRLSRRLKLTNETDPVKAELDLNGLVPPPSGPILPPDDSPRSPGVLRAEAELRWMRPGRHLPVGRAQRARRGHRTRVGGSAGEEADTAIEERPAASSDRSAWSSSALTAESSVSR